LVRAQIPSIAKSSDHKDAGGGEQRKEQNTIPRQSSPAFSAQDNRDKLLLYDVTYYGLELNVSTSTTAFAGNTTMKGVVGATPIDTIVIGLLNAYSAGGRTARMIADSVLVEGIRRTFIHDNNLIQIPVNPSFPLGSSFTTRVYYHGDDGGVGNGLLLGSMYGMTFLLTDTWPYYPSYLFPCKDMLEDWADSVNIAITTEAANKVIATGALVRTTPTGNGKARWEFASRWGMTPADVMFAVGPYLEYRTSFYLGAVADSMVIRGFLFPNSPYLNRQIAALEKSKEYLGYFTDLLGVFPFWRNEYHFTTCHWSTGAMSALGFTLWSDVRLDTSVVEARNFLVYYVPHELSHAWFESTVGALTECDVWLAEGFATYAEELAMEHFLPESVAHRNMQMIRDYVMSVPGGSVYIPAADRYNISRVLDNRLTYEKGAAIVHILRFELGSDSLFFSLLKAYLAEFAGKAITGEMFKHFLERKTGRDFGPFFDQWYYGEGYPSFSVRWSQGDNVVKIVSAQTPSMPTVTPLFTTPLEFKLKYKGGDTTIQAYQKSLIDTFWVGVAHSIDSIEVDPNRWLLCKVTAVTSVGEEDQRIQPTAYELEQNYPNPFNPTTKIRYTIPVGTRHAVSLRVYDVLGREVTTLVNEVKQPGVYAVQWNAGAVASGVYFYRLSAGGFVATKKMLVLK
jgi:hypothetical protein